jgi:NitT/TauT family transport system ATP-binding protein
MCSDISIKNISHSFDGMQNALSDISLEIPRGETTVLLGASGCGKTTLLRLIAGLLPLQAGSIEREMRLQSGLSYVFQSPALLPWASARENIALPLELQNQPLNIDALIASVGLADKQHLRPFELSGGQLMRVSIARALASGLNGILLDEPFAALDEVTRQRLAELFDVLRRANELTAVFVTHNISEAVFLGHTIVLMGAEPGRIIRVHQVVGPLERTALFRSDPKYQAQCAALSAELAQYIRADS